MELGFERRHRRNAIDAADVFDFDVAAGARLLHRAGDIQRHRCLLRQGRHAQRGEQARQIRGAHAQAQGQQMLG